VIVVWQSSDGSNVGIFGRRYDPAGNAVGSAEFRVNSYTTGLQHRPRVALGGNGSFVVVWETSLQDGDSYGISARRYDASGLPTGPDFRVNAYTTGPQVAPAVAADAGGDFVVAWSSIPQDGDTWAVLAQRYDTTGTVVGGEFQVNTYTTSIQYGPSVASAPDGRFMVLWKSLNQDGNGYGVAARRFDASGVPQGADQLVNTYTTGGQLDPAVAADGAGNFIVSWTSLAEDGSGAGIFARRYEASGASDPPFLVNTHTSGNQANPDVAAAGNGDFVVVWTSPDGPSEGVFAQRFTPDLIFRDGFESGSLSAWSASVTDGGDLGPSAFAAQKLSSVGLQGVVDDTAGIYVEHDSSHHENRYRARFYFDPNGFDPGEAQSHFRTRIFIAFDASGFRLMTLVLKRQAGAYSLEARVRRSDGTRADTGFLPIVDGPHAIEFDWQRATGPGAGDGSLELWIDGASVASLSAIDNDVSPIDFVRMGAFSVKTGASGALYWDEFESRRGSYIGP
jgi:hypothetical protein